MLRRFPMWYVLAAIGLIATYFVVSNIISKGSSQLAKQVRSNEQTIAYLATKNYELRESLVFLEEGEVACREQFQRDRPFKNFELHPVDVVCSAAFAGVK